MLNYIKITGGPLYSNSYIVYNARGRGFIVDAGVEPFKIYELINELNIDTIEFIVLTHGHFDHVFYAGKISEKLGVDVYLHRDDLEIFEYSAIYGEYLYRDVFVKPRNLVLLGSDSELYFGDVKVKIIHTPGHSPGSVCILVGNFLFTGDTLFKGTVGRTDLPGGSSRQLAFSLRKIALLPGDYIILPGHGEESSLKRELVENYYLKKLIEAHNTNHNKY